MSASATGFNSLDETSFDRLHRLVSRGYMPALGAATGATIALRHPRASRRRYVPDVMLWADGSLTTTGLLWPAQHVPCDAGTIPAWQRFILANDHATFARFAESIERPTLGDLYVRPLLRAVREFLMKFTIGWLLCIAIAAPCQLIFHVS